MAAVPKNKRSKAKRNTKRNSFKLSVLSIVECPRCRAKKISHRVCQACGYYDNKEIIQIEKKTKEKGSEKTKETAKTKNKSISKTKNTRSLKQDGGKTQGKDDAVSKQADKPEDNITEKAVNS